jgi:hypothetical protein
VNPPDIGGRFSALSLFGLVPAALIGLQPEPLIEAGRRMADACRVEGAENPGRALGVFMANAAGSGRDKLTVILPDTMSSLGAWIEQLVAESTGKDGRGVLPIVGQSFEAADRYGPDRAFVVASSGAAGTRPALLERLESQGHPVFHIETDEAVGAEFFRWEFATAVAGAALGVNPFDEPNVRDAKERTSRQLEERRRLGRFRFDPPLEPGVGFSWRAHRTSAGETGRYIAILDYLPADAASRAAVARIVDAVRAGRLAAVTHGIGPRYLHSTGQYHKGGPNTGRFLLLTADDASETTVPGTDYSFSALKQAQALGDFEALVAAGRDLLHYHLPQAADGLDAARAHVLEQLEA